MKIVTRKDAINLGLPRYFTGRVCKHGHLAERHTINLTCCECNRIKARKYSRDNKELVNRKSREHYKLNRSKYIETALIRASKLKQRSWTIESEAIRQFYINCPEGHHVDHEIPLKHELVCGLHCIANLQYLPAKENLAKSNRWIPDWSKDHQ